MPLHPDTLKELTDILKRDGQYAKVEDVARLLAGFKPALTAIGNALDKKLSTSLAGHLKEISRIEARLQKAAKESSDSSRTSFSELTKILLGHVKDIRDEVSTLRADYSTAITLPELDLILADLLQSPELAKDTAVEVRDKLASLEDEDRLDISAIKGWEEFSKEVRGIASSGKGGTIITQQRGAVRYYDLSPQLNGVKTTFALPAFARVLSVQSTSFPAAFRADVDYNTDGAAMTITFTEQIDPATTLAEGQTLTILYAEN